MTAEHKLFFILGVKKSGTTWLQHLVTAHPNIYCHGEGNFHQFGQQLLVAAKAYNLKLKDKTRVFGSPTFPPMDNDEFLSLMRAFIVNRLMRHTPRDRTQDLLWIGEKDPDHGAQANLMMAMFPKAAFIHIIRDPRDAAVSWWHHIYRFDGERAKQEHPKFNLPALQFAQEWASLIQKVRTNQQRTGVAYHELRYEDLVQKPHVVLGNLFSFMQVRSNEEIISRCIEKASFEAMSGGRQRGEEDRFSFYRKGIIGDWQRHMSGAMAQIFMESTGNLMQDLGYSNETA